MEILSMEILSMEMCAREKLENEVGVGNGDRTTD